MTRSEFDVDFVRGQRTLHRTEPKQTENKRSESNNQMVARTRANAAERNRTE